MELGWLDICLRVEAVAQSRPFYEALGFRRVEGADEEGWAVMVNVAARIGLYEAKHMPDAPFCLNFRGGDVVRTSKVLENLGIEFQKPLVVTDSGGASATCLDPDGYTIFFDTLPGETMPTQEV